MPLANFSQSDHLRNSWSKNLLVSFELPRHAAKELHRLAISGDRHLKEVGVIKVEIRELTDEWNRVKQDSDAKKLAKFQRHQAFSPRSVPGASNSAQGFPWQHQQAPLQFTYYTSQQPQQHQLVRDRADVRLYSLPTNDKAEYKTKIIGISRGVLTDESVPVDSMSQEAVPSWLIESSLCISFRRHGKCDVACQTGSERIMYRPRPSSFRYDAPSQPQPGSTGLLLDNNGRYKVYGNSAPYHQDTEKSNLPKEMVKRQCSSESIRILESLANSLVTAEERAGEAVSGAYPLSKKHQQEVRDKASEIVRSESRLTSPPVDKVGNGFQPPMHIYNQQSECQTLLKDGLSYAPTSYEAIYRQPAYVSREETLWSIGIPKANVGTVKGNRNASHAKRLSKKEENRKLEAMTSSVQVRGLNERIFADKDQALRYSHAQSMTQEAKVTENNATGLVEKRLEKQDRRIAGYGIEPEKDLRQSLAGQLVNSEDKSVEPRVVKGICTHLGNVNDSSQRGAEGKTVPGDKSTWEGGTNSSCVLLDNIGSSMSSYDVKGGSLPISVTLDSSYLQGISARGIDGKYRRPVVKDEPSEKVNVLQQSGNSNVVGITAQTVGTGTKRKRRRSSKPEAISGQMAPSEPAMVSEVVPSEPAKRKKRRPSRAKSDVVDPASAHAKQLETLSGSQALDNQNVAAEEGILRKLAVEEMTSKIVDRMEVNTSQMVVEYDAEAQLASSGVELQGKEAPIFCSMSEKVIRDGEMPSVEIMQKEDVNDTNRCKEFSRKYEPAIDISANDQSSHVRVKEDGAEITTKKNCNTSLGVPTEGTAPIKAFPTSSLNIPLQNTDSLTSGQLASPCETGINVRSRSQRWHPKGGIHREIEEHYFHSYRSVACETEQLLPDDIYYGENYPIVFADDVDISMKFVDMSTAFKLAMKGRLPTNYSSRDEKRGFKPVTKTKPQPDLFKKDASLYEKTLRKRTCIENRPVKMNQTKQRSSDHDGDVELVAEMGMRRTIDEEEPHVKPSHQMSLRPRQTKAIEDDYLSSDSLEGDDTEPDTGSLYESDESSDSEPLINKIRNSGKIREKLGKQTIFIPKIPISSDDDGESDKKLQHYSWKSAVSGEFKRSESVSTSESDTFDLIPPKKKSLPESRPRIPQAASMNDLKFERNIHSSNGDLPNKAATNTAAEFSKDYSDRRGIYVPRDPQNDNVLMQEDRATRLGVYPSDHNIEASAKTEVMTQSESTSENEDASTCMPYAAREVKAEGPAEMQENPVEQDKFVADRKHTLPISRPLALDGGSTVSQIGCTEANKELIAKGDQSIPKEDHMLLESSHTRTENGETISSDGLLQGGENSTLKVEYGCKAQPSELTHTPKGNSSISDRSVGIALSITTADTVKVDCEILSQSQIKNTSIQRPCEEDGSHDVDASVGKSRKGGSFITKLLKKSIQKISHTLGRGKEQVFKETKGTMKNSTAGGYVEMCTPKSQRKGKDETALAQSTGEKDGKGSVHSLSYQTADESKSVDFIGSSVSNGDGEVDTPLMGNNSAGSIRNGDNKVRSADRKIGECVSDDEKTKVVVFGGTSSYQELPQGTENDSRVDNENNGNDNQSSVGEGTVAGIGVVRIDSLGEVLEPLRDRPPKELTTGGVDVGRDEKEVNKTYYTSSDCINGSQPLPIAETEQNVSHDSALGIQAPLPFTMETGGTADGETIKYRPKLSTDEFATGQGLEALCEAACIEMEENKFEFDRDILKDGSSTSTTALASPQSSDEIKKNKPTGLAEDFTSSRVENVADQCFDAVKQSTKDAKNVLENEGLTEGQIDEGEKALAITIKSDSAISESSAVLVPKEGIVSGNGCDTSGNVCSTASHDSGLSTNCDQACDEVKATREMPYKDVVDRIRTTERSDTQGVAADMEPEYSNAVNSGIDEKESRNSLPAVVEEKISEEAMRHSPSLSSKRDTSTGVEDADQLMKQDSLKENPSREERHSVVDDHILSSKRSEHFDAADLGGAEASVIEIKGYLHLGKIDEVETSECASQKTSADDEIEEQQESETVELLEERSIKLEVEVGVEKDSSGKEMKLRGNEGWKIEIEGNGLNPSEVLNGGRIEKGVHMFSGDKIKLAEIEEMKETSSALKDGAKEKSTIGSDSHLENVGEVEKEEEESGEDIIAKQENECTRQCADDSNEKRNRNIAGDLEDDSRKDYIRNEGNSKESSFQISSKTTEGSSAELDVEEDVSQESNGVSQKRSDVSQESCAVSQKSSDVSQESYDESQESSDVSQKSIVLNVGRKKNLLNSMGTSKRQKPNEEGETFASKMLKLDVADGEVDVEIKLVHEKFCSRDGNGIDNTEDDNAEFKEGCYNSDASSKAQALMARDKIDTRIHNISGKELYEKVGNKRELSVVHEHSETRKEVFSSTNAEEIADGRAKGKSCANLLTRQKSNEIVADKIDNCLEVRVELTDALECIRQYQESSDEESVGTTSVDGEVADFTKSIERQSYGFRESSANLTEAESGASAFMVRSRRYSTTESDARPRGDKPKRRKSAADSDLTDGSHIVLTRRMRRESVESPAKRLRSSKS